jgi:hypothetical protein
MKAKFIQILCFSDPMLQEAKERLKAVFPGTKMYQLMTDAIIKGAAVMCNEKENGR